MSMEEGMRELDHGARRLQGAMLDHPNLAIERMPGLSFALNRFIAEVPARLASLIARSSSATIEEIRATTLFEAIGECSGLTAAIYVSAEPEAHVMIALDERIDSLIVSSIFGEAVSAGSSEKLGPEADAEMPRTPLEVSLVEAFMRALGEALETAFASVARVTLAFERLTTIQDPFALGRRDGEAAAARFTLDMSGGTCQGLLLLPQAFLLPYRAELTNDPEAEAPAADRRWSRLMEAGVQRTRLPVTAILEEVPMSLGDVANFQVGGLLSLRCSDFNAIRLECSGRGMFTCKLGQADGRFRLEVESPIPQGREALKS
jgi:flagellar motor switch protein FliM